MESNELKKPGRPKKMEIDIEGPGSPVTPRINYKGTQGFRHDLFRLKPLDLMRNLSFKKGRVQIERIPHTHFFHTFDSNGRPQQYCTPTGGHFHEIKWYMDPQTGEPRAECGPALRYVYKKRAGMQKRYLEAVKWEDEVNDSTVIDNHVHECEYAWSENLSADTIKKRRDASELQARNQIAQTSQAKDLGIEGL